MSAPLRPHLPRHLAGMDPIHNRDRGEHHESVEDVDERLVSHDIAVEALQILHHPDHGPDEDEDTHDVEAHHVPLPPRQLEALRRWHLAYAHVEECSSDDEKTEEYELHEQARDDDGLARVDRVSVAASHESTAGGLHQEAEDVAANEDLGEPGPADEEGLVAVDHQDDAAKLHVDRCGEECWRDKEQECLNDVPD